MCRMTHAIKMLRMATHCIRIKSKFTLSPMTICICCHEKIRKHKWIRCYFFGKVEATTLGAHTQSSISFANNVLPQNVPKFSSKWKSFHFIRMSCCELCAVSTKHEHKQHHEVSMNACVCRALPASQLKSNATILLLFKLFVDWILFAWNCFLHCRTAHTHTPHSRRTIKLQCHHCHVVSRKLTKNITIVLFVRYIVIFFSLSFFFIVHNFISMGIYICRNGEKKGAITHSVALMW